MFKRVTGMGSVERGRGWTKRARERERVREREGVRERSGW